MPTGTYIRTPEILEKMSTSHLGQIAWNKGLRGDPRCRGGFSLDHRNHFWIHASDEQKEQRAAKISSSLTGRMLSEEHREKNISTLKNRLVPVGQKHYRWNPNRNEVRYDRRNDPEYKQWRLKVYRKDGFVCRLADESCQGGLEAHHVLSWSEFPAFRYDINNGITLCGFHHPRKRSEEKRMVPIFQKLLCP